MPDCKAACVILCQLKSRWGRMKGKTFPKIKFVFFLRVLQFHTQTAGSSFLVRTPPSYHLLNVNVDSFLLLPFSFDLRPRFPLLWKYGALAPFSCDLLCVSLYSRLLAGKAGLFLVSFSSCQTNIQQGNVK